jgi:hypothetical protein
LARWIGQRYTKRLPWSVRLEPSMFRVVTHCNELTTIRSKHKRLNTSRWPVDGSSIRCRASIVRQSG